MREAKHTIGERQKTSRQHLWEGVDREGMMMTKYKLGRTETVQEVERKLKEQRPTDATSTLQKMQILS